jgi:hypothetical protein
MDSSRYFVVRVSQGHCRITIQFLSSPPQFPGSAHRFIGMGFVERNDAFNFKYELQRFSQQATE